MNMYSFTRRSSRAFTLIELLVVMAIIGVLSAVVSTSLLSARAKGRDSQRLQALVELQKSIELYFATYNQYPTACGGVTGAYKGAASNFGSCTTDYISGLTPTYIPKLPIDPSGTTADGYIYQTDASRQNYKVMVYNTLENYTTTKGDANSRCPSSCANTYCSGPYLARYTAGAACW